MFFRKIEGMICNKWNLLMTVCFAFFVYAWTDKDDEVIFRILGGIPDYGGRTIEIVPLGKWLFLFGFFFLIACRTINMSQQIKKLQMYRYQKFVKWWSQHFTVVHMVNAFTFFTAYLIWRLICGENGKIEVVFVFFLHLSCMISILLLFDFIGKKTVPCILIIIEGMGYVLSVNYDISWLACGMYNRSILFREGGFSVGVFILEIVIILFCYMGAPYLWKKEILERKMQ